LKAEQGIFGGCIVILETAQDFITFASSFCAIPWSEATLPEKQLNRDVGLLQVPQKNVFHINCHPLSSGTSMTALL
jgi:hypothetical protein